MSIQVEERAGLEEWNDLLARSPERTPYHRSEFLTTCAEYSNCRLRPYVGYKGEEPIGLFPVFELSRGPFAAAFSPPPELKIPYLGPALVPTPGIKRRKLEQRNRNFVEAVLDRVGDDVAPRFTQVRTSPAYTDDRPFLWEGHEATKRYTYTVDLTPSEEDLIMAFSKDARRNVRTDEPYEVFQGDVDDLKRVLEAVRERHDEQNIELSLPESFAVDLFRRLPDDCMTVHVCTQRGTFCGGEITLQDDDTVYGWLAAGDHSCDLPVNDVVCWHVMRESKREGYGTYDMIGANDPRLSSYKSKFGPELDSYSKLTAKTVDGHIASKLYQWAT